MKFLESLKGSQTLVFGAGVTGTAATEFLKDAGSMVQVIDEREEVGSAIRSVERISLSEQRLAIVSPGWRLDNPLVRSVREAGIEVLSEIDFAWRVKNEVRPKQIWLSLTGTNGKTTTVQMAEAMLRASEIDAKACGNVGDTAIANVAGSEYSHLILELSSFQLSWSHEATFKASALLNIAEDHIDWHGSFAEYAKAKFRIANMCETFIANFDDTTVKSGLNNLHKQVVTYTLGTPALGQIGLVEELIVDRAFAKGDAEVIFELQDVKPAIPHNVANAMAASGLALSVGVKHEAISSSLKTFHLDHHRLEVVVEKDGVKWIDDSKATNPHAAKAALFSQERAIWIAGGLAKGADMDDLIKSTSSRIKSAILIGTDAPLIAAALQKYAPNVPFETINLGKTGMELMREVVRVAKHQTASGDTVLLAPACASMDQFKDYADRGQCFASAVKEALYV